MHSADAAPVQDRGREDQVSEEESRYTPLARRDLSSAQQQSDSHLAAEATKSRPRVVEGDVHTLDLTREIADIRTPNLIEIVARDETPYAIHVAVCDYVGPDALFDRLRTVPVVHMPSVDTNTTRLSKWHSTMSRSQMVVLDSDHEDDDEHELERIRPTPCFVHFNVGNGNSCQRSVLSPYRLF